MTSISDLPLELLERILHLHFKPTSVKYAYEWDVISLHPFLLLNKRIYSVAAKYLYKHPKPFDNDKERTRQLFETLLSAARGLAFFPYHLCAEDFSVCAWRSKLAQGRRESRNLQELLDWILHSGRLRRLDLTFPKDLLFLATSPGFDVSRIRHLEISFNGQVNHYKSRSLIKDLTSRMHLESLDLALDQYNDYFAMHNTVKTLDLARTFLAPQSATLTSLRLFFIKISFPPEILLPNVKTLHIHDCRLEGWNNICASLSSLKELNLSQVEILDISSSRLPATIPASSRLESLEMILCHDLDGLTDTWLEAHSKSCPKLRRLRVGDISDNALISFLTHCHNLETFGYLMYHEMPGAWDFFLGPNPTTEHLEILVRFAPPTLRTLILCGGQFEDSDGLDTFIASCPASVNSLTLSHSLGITPSRVRALLQMPLTELVMVRMPAESYDKEELEHVLEMEKPLGLKILKCDFGSCGW